jgi:predicted SnoaL-like aldol condensation-catalyzing enzyme
MPDLERNKANVIAFYDLAFHQGRPREAMERYAGAEYIQHNPCVATGKQGFIDYFEKTKRDYPGMHVEFKRAIAEGNYVVLHCRQELPGDHVWAAMDNSAWTMTARSSSIGTCCKSSPTMPPIRTACFDGVSYQSSRLPSPTKLRIASSSLEYSSQLLPQRSAISISSAFASPRSPFCR